ncbi:unnamed protein product [Calypogeia fissa]
MVASSSGSGIDRLNLTEAAEKEFSGGEGVVPGLLLQIDRNSRAVKSPETSLPNSPRSRESGLVVSLFPTRPHIFGISQTQQLDRENALQGDCAETLEGPELRPLEAEALSLSRMLKSLQPLEAFPGFSTSAVPVVGPFPPASSQKTGHERHLSQERNRGETVQGTGGDGSGVAEEPTSLRPDKGLRVAVKGRSDGFSGDGGLTNANLPPTGAKSKRRVLSYSSQASTPSSSIGSASELQFPTVDLRSPPSPEPLLAPRPGSPIKWRPKTPSMSPLEESHLPKKFQETPVQGLVVERNISVSDNFAGNMTGKVLFQEEKKKPDANEVVPVESERSAMVRRMKAAYIDMDEEELLNTMIPQGVPSMDANGKDYSIALEYHGPPIGHEVPKVEPLDASAVPGRPFNEPRYGSKPTSPSNNGKTSSSSRPRSSVSFVNPFPAWFNNDQRNRDRNKRDTPSGSASEAGDDAGTSSAQLSPPPRSRTPSLLAADFRELETTTSEAGDDAGTSSAPLSPPPRSRTPSLLAADFRELETTTSEVSRSPLEPDLADVPVPVNTTLSGAAPTSSRTLEGTSDDESEFASKIGSPADSRASVSESFRAYAEDSIVAKSEPMGLWKQQNSVEYSNEDPYRQAGHKPRSMSLPGIQAIASIGSQAVGSHLTPTNGENSAAPKRQPRRKGECYHCHRGHRLTDKECCLVCNAKYCYNCVLTAMESMPEGRKCKECIGKPVDEAKRPYIGKPSRLLNRLLRLQEVQQIMKAEKECAANQLRPEQLYVNGRQLTEEELAILLKCPNPPQKLKPGRYWYDMQSGLWGKEGERPDKLISPDMRVGGHLQENASNGTTQVFMNGRELGKLELKMLKLAGVHCPPSTHLWVEPDGSYQEEGQNNFKGNIWNKTSIRLLYPFFSLPTPGASNRYTQRASPDIYMAGSSLQNKLQKILLLGDEGSGRSTLFKQTKFLFKEGFTREERIQMKVVIQRHIYRYIGILLEGRERFEEEDDDLEDNTRGYATGDYSDENNGTKQNMYALDGRLKQQAEWFSEMLAEGSFDIFISTSSTEYPLLVDELWRDPAIQATHKRRDDLNSLPDAAEYFLDKVVDLFSNDYLPSDEDILRAEGLAQGSGLAEVEFCLDDKMPSYQDHDDASPGRYQLIKVGGKGMSEGCKWLSMFEDVHAVVFCVAISEYDQVLVDNSGVSRSKLRQTELFESVLRHQVLAEKPMVLLLNKYDLFEEKICKGIPLTTCEWFSDFRPVGASQMTAQMRAQQGYTYVVHKYKELFASSNRKLFTFKLNAIEKEKVLEAFQYVREILKWKENGWDLFPDEPSYSTDFSSYQNFPTPGRDDFFVDRNKKSMEF